MNMQSNITFITGNPHKAEQVASYLGNPIDHHKLDLVEIQTLDIYELVEHKVKQAYEILKKPVLVEDVWMNFHAWGKLPGPFIKWFEAELGPQGVADMLEKFTDRSATVQVVFGLYDGEMVRFFEGIIEGTISKAASGTRGFGFDSIFIPNGFTRTRGEMDQDDYEATSHRKQALEKLEEYLKHTN
jgi:non-canonical purine NTP pyrophosphatase (RdgB/HAM1 family)